MCKNHTVSGVKEIGGRLRASPGLCVLITTIFASPELRVPMTTICLFLFFVLFCFVFVDLTQYCAILCSNILTVAETHKKHVLHINPSDVVSFPDLGLIMVTCLLKKKKRERERQRTGRPCTHTRLPSGGAATRWRTWKSAKVTTLAQEQRAKCHSSGLRKCLSDRLEISCKQGGLPLPSVNKTTLIS